MRVILKCRNDRVKIADLTDVHAMEYYFGGSFTTVPFNCSDGSEFVAVCSDDTFGLNLRIGGTFVYGDIIICGFDSDDYIGLTGRDIHSISGNLCWSPEDQGLLELFALAITLLEK